MSRGGGSAGTLTVTVGANTEQLKSAGRESEEVVRRLRRTVDAESVAMERSFGRMGGGLSAGIGRMRPLIAGAAASMVGMATQSNNAMGAVSRLIGTAAMGFSVGGPWGAAIGAAIGGIKELTRATNESSEAAKRAAEEQRKAAEAAQARASAFMEAQRRATAIASGVARAGDFEIADAEREHGFVAAGQVLMRQEAEQRADGGEMIRRAKLDQLRSREGADSPAVRAAEREAEIAQMRKRLTGEIADNVERAMRSAWRSTDFARDAAEKEEKRVEAQERQAKAAEAMVRHELDIEGMRRRVAERQARESADAEQARARAREVTEDFRHRLRVMEQSSDLGRMLVEQQREMSRYADNAAAAEALAAIHARQIDELKRKQAESEARIAEKKREQAAAEERAMFTARANAELAAREEARRQRAAQMQAYGAGYGPLAQARDAKRFSRNVEKNLRTEANLRAEAGSSMAYGTVGASQWTVDADGNVTRRGVPDPWASDLGSVYDSFRRPDAPVPLNAAPGLLMPPLPGEDGPGSGPAMPGDGRGLDEPVRVMADAASAAREAAGRIAESAGAIAEDGSEIGAATERAAGAIKNIEAIFVEVVAPGISSLADRLDSLEQSFAAANFFGGG